MSNKKVAERPERWDVPFDPEMTDERVQSILATVPFSEIDPIKFPKTIPLDGIIKNDFRFQTYKCGDIIVREGDYGNSAFFILSGKVKVILEGDNEVLEENGLKREEVKRKNWLQALAQIWKNVRIPEYRKSVKEAKQFSGLRTDGDHHRMFLQDVPRVLNENKTAEISEGEFFGEIAALGRTPRTATIFALDDGVELLEIKWQGLREIRQYSPKIKDHIDKLYRERSLATHLKETELFAHLNDEQIKEISQSTIFKSYGKFDWHSSYKNLVEKSASQRLDHEPIIVGEGNTADDLVLIRAGFARLSEISGSGHRTVNYIGRGAYFGFREIFHNWKHKEDVGYTCTLRCIGHVDVLVIPSFIIESIVLPTLPERLNPRPLLTSADFANQDAQDELKRRDKKLRLRTNVLEFLVENRFINGNKTMMINLDRCTRCDDCVTACTIAHDDNPRFLREGKHVDNLMVAQSCMHCQDPICMIGCPTGAIHRETLEGQVVITDQVCIGCSTCANSCPYGNIKMVEVRNEFNEYVLDSQTNQPIQKATKCDLCIDQVQGPSCELACPHDALIRIDLKDTERLAAWVRR